jgi:hypothetical protein
MGCSYQLQSVLGRFQQPDFLLMIVTAALVASVLSQYLLHFLHCLPSIRFFLFQVYQSVLLALQPVLLPQDFQLVPQAYRN